MPSRPLRFLLLFLVGVLALGTAFWLVPEASNTGPIVLAVIGGILGYNLWRRRSPRRGRRIAWLIVMPVLVTFFIAWVAAPEFRTSLTLSFPAAFAVGASLGELAERASGRSRPKIVRARWKGIDAVESHIGDAHVRFDIRAFTEELPKKQLKEIGRSIPRPPQDRAALAQKLLFLTVGPIILIIIPVAFTDETYVTGPDAVAQITGMAAFFSLLVLIYLVFGVLGMRGWRQATTPEEHVRLARFATANGFTYYPGPGRSPEGSQVTRVLTSPSGWILGNAMKPQHQAEDSVAPVTQFYGFAEVRLPVSLPHLFLQRKGLRPPVFATSRRPSPGQRLSLEGDFDRFFNTYCPKGYERDALYLLTPDMLASLIDGAREFDVEIIDDRLILRSRGDLVTIDPAVWQTIATAVSALAGRARQWALWRDDRHDLEDVKTPKLLSDKPTGAAEAGRRLRGGFGLGAILIGAYAVVYVGLVVLANQL